MTRFLPSLHMPRVAAGIVAGIMTAVPFAASGADASIGPDAWKELTAGKTLHYYKDGKPYGREYYDPDGRSVVFRAAGGQCAQGQWAYADEQFCFAYFGELHCFRHVFRGKDIYVIGMEDGDEQAVQDITDSGPLSCAEELGS